MSTILGAPEISIYPKARDIRKGRSITYQCRVSGLEPLTFLWEKSSGSTWTTVKSGSKLYTTNASLDIGQYVYRCKVSNRGGPVVSNNITVNVYGKYHADK